MKVLQQQFSQTVKKVKIDEPKTEEDPRSLETSYKGGK